MWNSLEEVAASVRSCVDCPLHRGRLNAVPGAGDPEARIMFIGEGPGYHEDAQGLPFVGAAGNLLNELLGEIGLGREQVFVANVIKCRAPQNRDPLPEEIESFCSGLGCPSDNFVDCTWSPSEPPGTECYPDWHVACSEVS